MIIPSSKNKLEIKIYYEDTDAAGIVYHSKYLNFAERARTEFLRSSGFEQSYIFKEFGMRFVVKKIDVNYIGYAVLDNTISVNTYITHANRAKVIFKQDIFNGSKKITNLEVLVTCINNHGRVARMPNALYYNFIKEGK